MRKHRPLLSPVSKSLRAILIGVSFVTAAHGQDQPRIIGLGTLTEGGKVSDAERKADGRDFTAGDIKKLGKNLCVKAEAECSPGVNSLRVKVGRKISPPKNRPTDRYLDAKVTWLNGPPSAEFGYVSNGKFVYFADATNTAGNETFKSLLYSAGVDFAVRNDRAVFSLEAGNGVYQLSNPNPNDPTHFLTAQVTINTNAGPATVVLDVVDGLERTGGFFGDDPHP